MISYDLIDLQMQRGLLGASEVYGPDASSEASGRMEQEN